MLVLTAIYCSVQDVNAFREEIERMENRNDSVTEV